MIGAAMMLVGLMLDAILGWPDRLFRIISHPVVWIGALIRALDRWCNVSGAHPALLRLAGAFVTVLVVGLCGAIGWMLTQALPPGLVAMVVGGLVAWPFIAARSLYDHVAAVAEPLAAGNLAAARHAVSRIVGRDPDQLDRAGIARAAIESLAENSSDGVVAPIFWGVIFGLPGIMGYKAINTLDSMIGHRTPRHRAFGWAAARLDDLVNLIPARLTGLLFALLSTRPKVALRIMWRDARKHRSPNAGWPEAAIAGGLDIRLSGPRHYADTVADEPWLNEGAPDPRAADFPRLFRLYRYAILALALVLTVCALL
ncbi:MAG: cobalamin biosynthesis protein CobD [Defluviimonas sp.]|uniref:adenosylcobinamide-phosphate synthase CbiB n=1 Tax=Albidovulum sp. TaxID=1872424 RepID=UPI001DBAEDE5|nr:cobalamin biosynthesis protein CobD [Paracoccaceae bacterium]MCC0064367.1 cobalamin biosynthesis protein CobD [Defluviimonas sp.]